MSTDVHRSVLAFRSCLLAAILQVVPVVRAGLQGMLPAGVPVAHILRWLTGAWLVSGSFHAVSGATTLVSDSSIEGRAGEEFSYQAQLTTNDFGDYPFYRATGVSPTPSNLSSIGLSMDISGTLTGTPTRTGTFRIRVTGYERSNFSGHSGSATITLVVSAGAPLGITTDPIDVTVDPGEPATFTVVATGAGRTYQWLKNDVAIDGATLDAYTIDSVQPSDAGNYSVRVTAAGNSVVSKAARLVVRIQIEVPVVTPLASGVAVHPGEPLRLAPVVTGTEPVTYEWRRSGTVLGSQLTSVLSIASASATDAGSYVLRATNAGGTGEAVVASVEIVPLVLTSSGATGNATVSWTAITGRTYVVERADRVSGANWVPLETVVADETTESVTLPASAAAEFIRVRAEAQP